jgi:hypothetical protein
MNSSILREGEECLHVGLGSTRNFHWNDNIARLAKLKRPEINLASPILIGKSVIAKNRSIERGTREGHKLECGLLSVSAHDVSATAHEVGTEELSIRDKTIRTISFDCKI